MAFSPDSKNILTGSADGTAVLWDTLTGAFIRPLCPLVLGDLYSWVGLGICFVSLVFLLGVFVQSINFR
jgi:WD40 repeat protein